MRVLLIVLGLVSLVQAADQTILGKQLAVKDPQPGVDATKRKIVGMGLERNSPNTVVGDPTLTGATLTVSADGTTATSQTYTLPAGLWTAINGGYKYKDPQLTQGPVAMALLKLVKGTFQLKARVLGKNGGITVAPPNTGTDGCLLLDLDPTQAGLGDQYHVRFPPAPESTTTKNDAKAFVVKNPTSEGVCVPVCSPGAPGCGWSDGDLTTFVQGDWGGTPDGTNAASLLANNFDTVYATLGGVLDVGIVGTGGFSMAFTSASAVLAFLPSLGTNGPLTSDLLNPLSSPAGIFGGEVVTLRLNVDFAGFDLLPGTAGVNFGNLTLCNFATLPNLNGMTVHDFLGVVSTLLGGGTSLYTIADLAQTTQDLNGSFFGETPTSFAQDHLVNGACP